MTRTPSSTLRDSGIHPATPTVAPTIAPEERLILLDIARAALAVATTAAAPSKLQAALDAGAALCDPAAVFVTLTERGELRGCVGSLEAARPLSEAVVAAAVSAALRDPRFRPVAASELSAIHVEISVLGPAAPFAGPEQFRPGIDGLIVERGLRRALLLPEVATDWGWGAAQMLAAVCEKAGLDRDAWQDERTTVSSFRTIRFGGPAVPADPAPVASRSDPAR